MSEPRFLFLASSGEAGAGSVRPGAVYLWRLVAGNNRVLGCSPVTYPDDEASRAAVEAVLRDLERAVPEPSAASRPGRWRWQLVVPDQRSGEQRSGEQGSGEQRAGEDPAGHEGHLLAVAARSFERQRTSRENLAQFLRAAPVATVSTALVVRPRPRVPYDAAVDRPLAATTVRPPRRGPAPR